MKKLISTLCALVMMLSSVSAFAASYEVREDMAMSYGAGYYVAENATIKSYCEKTGFDGFEYGYIVTYFGGFGGGGADASLGIDDTKGASKLVFDARILGDDFCTVGQLRKALDPEYVDDIEISYPDNTTCDVSVQQSWEDEYDENFPQKWIELTNEWKHYEVDIADIDACRVYINPLGAKDGAGECCAALVANLKLVTEDGKVIDAPMQPAEPVPSDWAKTTIEAAKKRELLGDWITDYQRPITRREFAELMVTTILSSLGIDIDTYKTMVCQELGVSELPRVFKDIDDDYVVLAVGMGITNGVTDTEFMPDKNITRQEIAVMMHRAIKFVESAFDERIVMTSTDLSAFSDSNLVADWAKEGVGTLAKAGIMQGTSDTTLSPLDNATTEQAIALAVRIHVLLAPNYEYFG